MGIDLLRQGAGDVGGEHMNRSSGAACHFLSTYVVVLEALGPCLAEILISTQRAIRDVVAGLMVVSHA
jgi:hypothetical protein